MPLNEDKCIAMVVNNKSPYPERYLVTKGKVMKIEKETKYLGDVFNENGDNKSLVKDRKNKAVRCLVGCFSDCNIVTRGCKSIQSLLLLYKTVYVPTVIFNCEAWDNINKSEWDQLHKIQMKFLKRILQVPASTPNSIILLELGVVPIKWEIKKRQLNFLHDIFYGRFLIPFQSNLKCLQNCNQMCSE